ncbi:DNA processing protein DprA [Zhongshania aliphaticivorans]|uniref:DNA processing protein DprA n=1 Tax=Zhongshania aliphaticivorans TaxID=1470434 RepID=A0A5S9PLW8_9GAMM|nr:DNA-processing protein DprA [Zhongshania aliphaticivorans]CAA0104582.1 DNA processing protein DprA [Zhongshania aliphaticivorans]CAA0104832.1 DNA processing protein DprA [Zhongshania aliphaticivorans]
MEILARRWLQVQQCLALPPAHFRRLVLANPSPHLILDLPLLELAKLGISASQRRVLAQELSLSGHGWVDEALASADADVLCFHDDDYPALLKEIHDAPPLLYYRGRTELLRGVLFSVVGSRRPSRAGRADAQAFATALGNAGFTTVSGMALGVDTAAHIGALISPSSTIAVLGTGVDQCYPKSNRVLYDQIASEGLLLSEFPLGSPPLRHQFPRRNRIISGMSLGVLVVEAAIHSGSLITARQALEQNREVFAIPGSIHNPASRGCNALIKQGAKLVDTLSDIIEEFSGWANTDTATVGDPEKLVTEEVESRVYDALGYEPISFDEVVNFCGLSVADALAELGDLELGGWVEQYRGGWQRSR